MKLYVIFDCKTRYHSLSGRALTDALIRECLGRKDLVIERTEKGKPYLADPGQTGCHISVSHSEGTFALLAADENIGLDIQYRRNVDAVRIASRCFTEEEAAYAAADPSGDMFYRLWTRAEAYSKYTGTGMEQIMRKEPVLSGGNVSFLDLRLRDGCFCAICMKHKEKEGGRKPYEIQISYGE